MAGHVDLEARKRERAACRRPISEEEARALEVFGAALRVARRAAELTQMDLGLMAGRGEKAVYRLEAAVRRPRRSTIEDLVAVIVDRVPALGGVERLTNELCALAGVGLAPESEYRERVERRRTRRLGWRAAKAERNDRIREQVFDEVRRQANRERLERAEAKRREAEAAAEADRQRAIAAERAVRQRRWLDDWLERNSIENFGRSREENVAHEG